MLTVGSLSWWGSEEWAWPSPRDWGQAQRWGARVNSISPGVISTTMGAAELSGPNGDYMRQIVDASPARRLGTPYDIASAVEFLAGPNSTFVTGTDL